VEAKIKLLTAIYGSTDISSNHSSTVTLTTKAAHTRDIKISPSSLTELTQILDPDAKTTKYTKTLPTIPTAESINDRMNVFKF